MLIKLLKLSILLYCHEVSSENILFIALDPGLSHASTFTPIISELLNRGHKVTSLVSLRYKIKSENYTEILVEPLPNFHKKISFRTFMKDNIITKCNYKKRVPFCIHSNMKFLNGIFYHGKWFTEFALDTQVIEKFIKNNRQKFDLVISELFVQEMMYMFAHMFKAPLVLISTFDYEYRIFDTLGMFSAASHVPLLTETYERHENVFNRLISKIFVFFMARVRKYSFIPLFKEILESKFEKYEPLPDITDIERNVSLIMFNSLQVLNLNKPKVKGVVDIARITSRPSKPLQTHISSFIENAKNGVIYVSFGSILKTSLMPENLLNIFRGVFKRTKMHVLMKFETRRGVFTKNVMTDDWLPQNSILAHGNVKLFITHGGIGGIQEAIQHGVPMIVIPIFGDQFHNAIRVHEAEIGLNLPIMEMTEKMLYDAINEINTNDKYRRNIQKLSDIYKNSPTDPLKDAVFWIEHLMKHRDYFDNEPKDFSIWVDFEFFFHIFIIFRLLKFFFKKFSFRVRKRTIAFTIVIAIVLYDFKMRLNFKFRDQTYKLPVDN